MSSGNDKPLLSHQNKMLVGYPLNPDKLDDWGKLHASTRFVEAFSNVSEQVFRTKAVQSYPGNSGGPLYVQHSEDGKFYPAAIYLGGSGETLVRVIDEDVVRYINYAEAARKGDDSTGSPPGVPEPPGTRVPSKGTLSMTISPPNARWRPVDAANTKGKIIGFFVGSQAIELPAGSAYNIEFSDTSGYKTPGPVQVNVEDNQKTSIEVHYEPLPWTIEVGVDPPNAEIDLGSTAAFEVKARVNGELDNELDYSYQWRLNGNDLPKDQATDSCLLLEDISENDSGDYTVYVSRGIKDFQLSQAIRLVVRVPLVKRPAWVDWLLQYFNKEERGQPEVAGPDADPDGDGISNWQEYALNLSPRVGSTLQNTSPGKTTRGYMCYLAKKDGEKHWAIEFVRRKESDFAKHGLRYFVEFSHNMKTWCPAIVPDAIYGDKVEPIDETWERVFALDRQPASVEHPHTFVRLKLETYKP